MSEPGSVSDGFHTFDELYAHRHLLFLNFMRLCTERAWVSRRHSDGTKIEGWFIAGIELPTGQISYHLPDSLWGEACRHSAVEHDQAPWDGHTAADVLARLQNQLSGRPQNADKDIYL